MRKVYTLIFSLLFVAGATFAQEKANYDVVKVAAVSEEAPVIDGLLDDMWDDVETVPFTLMLGTEVATVTAYWKAMWDEDNIYVFVNVEDDNYYPGWEAGGAGWEYDKPEIYFDVNDVLNDGAGPATASSGHYQWSPDPTDGGEDTPMTVAGTTQAPGGTYCYHLDGENYAYEFAVEIGTMSNVDGVAMTWDAIQALPELMGFDATVIDQDQDITTGRQRTIWQCGDGAEGEAWNTMDPSGTMTLIDVSSINDVKSVNVTVHPNPVTDFLTINADFDKVVINNILGQEISSMNQIRNNRLDVGNLSKGVYIIKVYKGERYIGAAKITKN